MPEPTPSLRHLVYDQLLLRLSYLSQRQAETCAANLGLIVLNRNEPQNNLLQRAIVFHLGTRARVSPDLDETLQPFGFTICQRLLEAEMVQDFGDLLHGIAGFWLAPGGVWRVNLPLRCFLLPYYLSNAAKQTIAGLLCVKSDAFDQYFLLSSGKLSFGARAVPLPESEKTGISNFYANRNSSIASCSRNTITGT